MSEVKELVQAMALTTAYQIAKRCVCLKCGLPSTRVPEESYYAYEDSTHCDKCQIAAKYFIEPGEPRVRDLPWAPAVRRLMKIAKNEFVIR